MDVLQQAKLKINFGTHTWSTQRNIEHKFSPADEDSVAQISAVAALGGVVDISPAQRKRLNDLLDIMLTETDTLREAKMTPHVIDVQGHRPIKQRLRRISPPLLSKAHEEIDRLLKEGIIEPSESAWSSAG